MTMQVDLLEVSGTPILSGAINGKTAFAELVKRLDREPVEPMPVFIDFKNIEAATASYLRESVFALKSYLRNIKSKLYPVAANANNTITDELVLVSSLLNDAIVSSRLVAGLPLEAELIGTLDPKQKMTFDLVSSLDGTDASALMDRFGESEQITGITAWNNRLAALVAKGVVREYVYGRSKFYRPLIRGVSANGR